MPQENNDSFTHQMRKTTRDVHKISDTLVNAKLAFALTDDKVWADGLLVFYEIFKYLEENVPVELLPEEFHRKEAFEKDLSYYLGPKWEESYEPRKEVLIYIDHLKYLTRKNPILLTAYVYHLYMGLLSGGQIIQKKRAIAKKVNIFSHDNLNSKQGYEITHFEEFTIQELKERMRNLIDNKAKEFDNDTKTYLIDEGRKVFELNNKVIRTVHGVNRANLTEILIVLLVAYVIYYLSKSYFG